jgi:1,4-dihydroxy-6-naphthoate synthase
MSAMEIHVAHSPDSDDAFMFYGLSTGKVSSREFRFTHILEDIESLNRKAIQGTYEVTAISIHAYAYVAGRYALLPSGASMGDRYGPLVVARSQWDPSELRGKTVAVPGLMTTAYLLLKLLEPDFEPLVTPFDRVSAAVLEGEADAGLLIHEGQLTYRREGLHRVVDLGEWWFEKHGLPLPLGGNAIRRDLGPDRIREISRLLRESIQYGLDHRQAALDHALKYARGLAAEQADRFVSMYVNERTLDYGPDGRKAVRTLLKEAWERKLIPSQVYPEFTE